MRTKKTFSLLILFTLLWSINVYAQTKIVTGHPDFKIKITRCEASGSTAVIDFLLENVGNDDVKISMYGGNEQDSKSVAYDDEGNKYGGKKFQIAISGSGLTAYSLGETLPPDIPLKARIQIEGVPESATEFKRVDLQLYCNTWNLNRDKKPVRFTNVPIFREGDE